MPIAGFYVDLQEQFFELSETRTFDTGNQAWAMIALLALHRRTGDLQYLNAARLLGNLINTFRHDTGSYQGFQGGLDFKNGDEAEPERRSYASTEHNLDIYAAFTLMFDLTGEAIWQDGAQHARQFIEATWDSARGCYLAGTTSPSLLNTNFNQLPLDVQPWSVLALPDGFTAHPEVLSCAENNHRKMSDGFTGFDFNTDRDGVWFEGTGHMATAYAWISQSVSADTYRQELNQAQATPPFGDGFGIAAASHDAVTSGFGFNLFRRLHVGATAWHVFAQLGFNPYYQRQKSSCPSIMIDPETLPNGSIGTAYSQMLTAGGGAAPRKLILSAGALPGGLTLTAGGLLSGTPNAAGSFTFSVAAIDANYCTGSRSYTIRINFTSPTATTFRVASAGAAAQEYPFQYGFARFYKDDMLFYHRIGGGGGGRGFNVAAIDTCTGELIQPVQNFDTWITGGDGTAMNAMISFLNGLPNGALILIAVADEAGLTQGPPNSCVHLTYPWVEAGYQALEALGSQKIRQYCFWNSWSMVTIKGTGQPIEEMLGNTVQVTAQTSIVAPPFLSPISQSFSSNGGNGNVEVYAATSCGWTAVSNALWITVDSGSGGNGNNTVNYSVATNNSAGQRSGTITIANQVFTITQGGIGYEADVAPRPNGSGTIVVSDWVQVGRFSVGLDTPSAGSEFQRADCAPRATIGDGKITVADWVQAGRYSVGLDPLTGAGGPASQTSLIPKNFTIERTPVELRLASLEIEPGQQLISLPVELSAMGGENAIGFSLQFDPGAMRYLGVKRGRDLAEEDALLRQTARSNDGRVAFAIALKPGQSYKAGVKEILQLQFRLLKKMYVETEISIVDDEVVDARAGYIPVRSVNGILWRRNRQD